MSHMIGFRGRDAVPIYWENAHKDIKQAFDRKSPDFFDDCFPVAQDELAVLQDLIDRTRDHGELDLRIIRAVRIEHSGLWAEYQEKAAQVASRRGVCEFAGRGAPLTSEDFEGVPGLSEFTQDLDADICEAYLWHGTSPQNAWNIAKRGLQVNHHSVAGKRFGAGGYFAEDPARSDKYAGSGEGIYENCYAMLLCRVILGRQYHIREFKDEGATARAKGRYDSTLAEPRTTEWREFVVYESSQVYPEYALVYERRVRGAPVHNELLHDAAFVRGRSGGSLSSAYSSAASTLDEVSFPHYWFHTQLHHHYFHDSYPAEAMEPVVQALMTNTWTGRYTADRARPRRDGGPRPPVDPEDVPEGLHVLKVLRMEDSQRWTEYLAAQERVRLDCSLEPRLGRVCGVKTVDGLPAPERSRLCRDVNEVYLWHGCSPSVVHSVALSGFPKELHAFNHGTFGHGAYFVEDSDHADEYSSDDKEGYYRGYYAMLLCRVTLGRAQILQGPDPIAESRIGPGRPFDSAIGPVPCSFGAFREFMVTDRDQVYPEYAVIYERLHRRATTARFSFSERG